MFSKTKIALSAAVVLSTVFPASAATKHHRVNHAIQQFTTWSPRPLAAAARRLVVHLAVAIARGLALVHHQIAGDESFAYFVHSTCLSWTVGICAASQPAFARLNEGQSTAGLSALIGPRWR